MTETDMTGLDRARTSVLRAEERLHSISGRLEEILARHPGVFLALASLAYLVTTVYRAERRLFWFDELFTFYISRLPDLGSMWTACKNGADFNPPLLYLFTHWSQAVFGATHIGTRMPEILGFWLFCLCLYRFVSIRNGALAGWIALLFPLTTRGYWYAYDARSHGLVLGFFGLAFICWQALANGTGRRWAMLAGLSASLICAALCHAYAFLLFIPFGIGELTRTFQRRRLDPLVWTALLLPAVVSAATVLPLLNALHGAHIQYRLAFDLQALALKWGRSFQPELFFQPVLALFVMLLLSAQALTLRAGQRFSKHNGSHAGEPVPGPEIAVIAGLLSIPVFAFVAATLLGLPIYGRYSLVALAGVAWLVGVGCARSRIVGFAVLLLCVLFFMNDFVRFYLGSEISEPSTGLAVSTLGARSSFGFRSIREAAPVDDPVVLTDDLEFAPLFYYAPDSIRSRFVFLVPEVNGEGYARLQRCCGAPGTVMPRAAFRAAYHSFFVYGSPSNVAGPAAIQLDKGARITVEACRQGHCLYHIVPPASHSEITVAPAGPNAP